VAQTQVIFVTGKGGVGKTTVSAALAVHLAEEGQRVLIVESDQGGQLAELLEADDLDAEPKLVAPRVSAVRLLPRVLLEDYFRGLLRIPFLANRLLNSRSFNALTAAAPGVAEFLLLEKILGWADPGWRRRSRFDTILVDGPATGHALKLLAAPRTIASLVPGGPIGAVARGALSLLADHVRTHVCVVTLPEELSVTETIATYGALRDDLAVDVLRPVINRIYPRRFAVHEVEALAQSESRHHPMVLAAQYQLARRRDSERHIQRLRRHLPQSPVSLPMVFDERLNPAHLHRLGNTLAPLLAAGGA
jgi:anion-transporting  ArsA/GET3 family ATPase